MKNQRHRRTCDVTCEKRRKTEKPEKWRLHDLSSGVTRTGHLKWLVHHSHFNDRDLEISCLKSKDYLNLDNGCKYVPSWG